MCEVYYHQRSWPLQNSTFYMSVEAVRIMYFCSLFFLIKVTEKKTKAQRQIGYILQGVNSL